MFGTSTKQLQSHATPRTNFITINSVFSTPRTFHKQRSHPKGLVAVDRRILAPAVLDFETMFFVLLVSYAPHIAGNIAATAARLECGKDGQWSGRRDPPGLDCLGMITMLVEGKTYRC